MAGGVDVRAFIGSVSRAVRYATALTIAAALILWVYAAWRGLNAWDVVVNALASAFLSIGLITLIYDLVLKSQFAAEVVQLVGLQHSLAAAGVKEVGRTNAVEWNSILESAARFDFLLIEPAAWSSGT